MATATLFKGKEAVDKSTSLRASSSELRKKHSKKKYSDKKPGSPERDGDSLPSNCDNESESDQTFYNIFIENTFNATFLCATQVSGVATFGYDSEYCSGDFSTWDLDGPLSLPNTDIETCDLGFTGGNNVFPLGSANSFAMTKGWVSLVLQPDEEYTTITGLNYITVSVNMDWVNDDSIGKALVHVDYFQGSYSQEMIDILEESSMTCGFSNIRQSSVPSIQTETYYNSGWCNSLGSNATNFAICLFLYEPFECNSDSVILPSCCPLSCEKKTECNAITYLPSCCPKNPGEPNTCNNGWEGLAYNYCPPDTSNFNHSFSYIGGANQQELELMFTFNY